MDVQEPESIRHLITGIVVELSVNVFHKMRCKKDYLEKKKKSPQGRL